MTRRATLLAALVVVLLAVVSTDADAASGWLPATVVSGSTDTATEPRVAMDPGGDAIAVWEHAEVGAGRVEVATRPAGGAWGTPVLLTPPTVITRDPHVVIAPSGEAAVAWSTEGPEAVAQVATMSAAGTWGPTVTISAPAAMVSTPVLAVDPAGGITAAWQEYDGVKAIVRLSTRLANGSWSAPTRVSPPKGIAGSPSLAVDDHGDAVVVWSEQEVEVEAAVRLGGGGWSAPIVLSAAGAEIREPRIAMDAGGEAVATWNRYDGAHEVVQSATMGKGGAWSKAEDLSDGSYSAYGPQVVDAMGEAIVIWERSSPTEAVVEGTTRSAGASWSTPAALTPPDQSSGDADIAISPAGLAVLVWQGGPPVGAQTPYGATRPQGGAWTAPTALAPSGRPGNYPIAAMDAQGDGVAVWEAYGGGTDEIEAAGFDGAGPTLNAVSIPGSGQVGVPLEFSVQVSDVWSPVAAPSWLFGDGTIVKGFEVSHGFVKGGDFPVSVTAADGLGNSATATGSVAVQGTAAAGQGLAWADRLMRVHGGRAALRLHCGGGGDCAGVVKLYTPPRRGLKRRRRRPLLAGEATFQIAAAGRQTVRVRMRRNVRSRLRHSRVGRLGATLRGSGILPGKVILSEPRHRRPRRHR